jgi:hypothetical protein
MKAKRDLPATLVLLLLLLVLVQVREALVTSALLKLPRRMRTTDKLERVEALLELLVRGEKRRGGLTWERKGWGADIAPLVSRHVTAGLYLWAAQMIL